MQFHLIARMFGFSKRGKSDDESKKSQAHSKVKVVRISTTRDRCRSESGLVSIDDKALKTLLKMDQPHRARIESKSNGNHFCEVTNTFAQNGRYTQIICTYYSPYQIDQRTVEALTQPQRNTMNATAIALQRTAENKTSAVLDPDELLGEQHENTRDAESVSIATTSGSASAFAASPRALQEPQQSSAMTLSELMLNEQKLQPLHDLHRRSSNLFRKNSKAKWMLEELEDAEHSMKRHILQLQKSTTSLKIRSNVGSLSQLSQLSDNTTTQSSC
mmetsp:Transcript_43410/g.71700  ORF Transcript_43410/g.71700 Transcript_43410/m.71700 type:complete len:274 (-) Transcript_43410:32-853(-)